VCQKHNLAPTTFHFSGKASPSNVNSSTGIISDIYYLMAHPDGEFVFKNILSHLEVVGTVWIMKQKLAIVHLIGTPHVCTLDGAQSATCVSASQGRCKTKSKRQFLSRLVWWLHGGIWGDSKDRSGFGGRSRRSLARLAAGRVVVMWVVNGGQ
jgi:hypothetical protein